ncbi:MAG: ATPase [Bacteroidetes bacterium GWA2_31_9]|nr:MAG: ATPase [Bacteroidetes bacterium GWA2_31_9]
MYRTIQTQLINWKDKPSRLPLIIRGARQVGKTYMMKWFGENHFSNYIYLNFDEHPELNEFFEKNKDIKRIINSLSLISGKQIDENTLLIFDEIQECPEALNSLKYFAESNLNIPVISAGSLLGILLQSGHSFPVGKVEFLSMYPMSFSEVLPNWDENAANYLNQINSIEELPAYFFNTLVDNFKKYLITGGLPAVVKEFNQSNNFNNCDEILENLLLAYKGDFSKHPIMKDIAKITLVFDSMPTQLARENKKFVYQLVRQGARAKDYEDAIQWLIGSGLAYKVKQITKPAIPLSAYDDLSAFKLYAMDVGLIRRMSRLSPLAYSEGNRLFTEFKGAITENYILQSIISQFEDIPRYWTSGNLAEIDFIVQHNNNIIPIEVKSDENVKSRSLTMYHQKHQPALRIRYSLKNLHYREGLLNIPLFLSDYTKKFIDLIANS